MIRLQVNLPEERAEELEALMELTAIATRKELFNTALTLFEWAVKESYFNRIIASMERGSGNYKELAMPSLDTARRAGWTMGIQEENPSAVTIPFFELIKRHHQEEFEEEEVEEEASLEAAEDKNLELEPA